MALSTARARPYPGSAGVMRSPCSAADSFPYGAVATPPDVVVSPSGAARRPVRTDEVMTRGVCAAFAARSRQGAAKRPAERKDAAAHCPMTRSRNCRSSPASSHRPRRRAPGHRLDETRCVRGLQRAEGSSVSSPVPRILAVQPASAGSSSRLSSRSVPATRIGASGASGKHPAPHPPKSGAVQNVTSQIWHDQTWPGTAKVPQLSRGGRGGPGTCPRVRWASARRRCASGRG